MMFLGVALGAILLIWFASLATQPALAATREAGSAAGSLYAPLVGAPAPPAPTESPSAEPAPEPDQEAPAAEQPAEAQTGCGLHAGYPENVQRWCSLIERYASDHGLDPNLVAAVMLLESAGNPEAYSRSGAVGLMQVMPRDGLAAAFQCKNGPCFSARPSMAELYDPDFNVSYGVRMLAGLYQRTSSLREALRAYGPGDAGYTYADKVLGIYAAHGGQ